MGLISTTLNFEANIDANARCKRTLKPSFKFGYLAGHPIQPIRKHIDIEVITYCASISFTKLEYLPNRWSHKEDYTALQFQNIITPPPKP